MLLYSCVWCVTHSVTLVVLVVVVIIAIISTAAATAAAGYVSCVCYIVITIREVDERRLTLLLKVRTYIYTFRTSLR